ncbi:cupin domain-containing protein [Salana multivorans]
MTDTPAGPATQPSESPGMTYVPEAFELVEIQPESTVSRTVLKAEGVRVVLFGFDAGQVLTEHTAAMPVVLHTVRGHLRVTADGRTVDLLPGDLLHLRTREPHAVEAVAASILSLTMVDARRS